MTTETRIFLEKAMVVVMNDPFVLSPNQNFVRKGGETEPKVAPLRALFRSRRCQRCQRVVFVNDVDQKLRLLCDTK
jgi:hypothetical protein